MGLSDEYTLETVDEEDLGRTQHSGYKDVVAEGRQAAVEELGPVGSYLEGLSRDAGPARNAPQRVADMLEQYGSTYDADLDLDVYNIFTEDPLHDGRHAFYDEAVFEAVDRFVRRTQTEIDIGDSGRVRRLPLPEGEAGTTAARLLRRYLEDYTMKEEGRLYTFEWRGLGSVIDDQAPDHDTVRSPLNQDPLVLLTLDESAFETLNARRDAAYTMRNEQRLDPESVFYLDKLLEYYDGDMTAVLCNHVEVIPVEADGDVPQLLDTVDADPAAHYDEAQIVGEQDRSKMALYGSEDPRAFGYDGGFQNANRGILEVEHFAELPVWGISIFEDATNHGSVYACDADHMDLDQVIITRGPGDPFDVMRFERNNP